MNMAKSMLYLLLSSNSWRIMNDYTPMLFWVICVWNDS